MVSDLQVRIHQWRSEVETHQNGRANKEVTKHGERNAFFIGGNSSCRTHIRRHYKIYKDRCEEAGIPESHHAIPRPLWKKMEEEKREAPGKRQKKIDGMFVLEPSKRLNHFTRDGALDAIAMFVVCNDQVQKLHMERTSCWNYWQALAVVEDPAFHNCLTAMRPTTTRNDLPSTHNTVVHIHNEFVAWLTKLKDNIQVSR